MSLEIMRPTEALAEAERRLGDTRLQGAVDQYLGGVWPPGFEEPDMPQAVFAPYLEKGSRVEVDFLGRAALSGFATVVATYRDAKYVTANPGIVDCWRAPLCLPKGQRRRAWVVPNCVQSVTVGGARTIYPDLGIVDYWKGVRSSVLEENGLPRGDKVVDFGGWYAAQARRFGWDGTANSKSGEYYMALMALYASGRAVLWDTPSTSFALATMKPAFDAARDALGVTPLVTQELQPDKRDWVDVSFLDEQQVERLLDEGRIA